MQLIGNRWIVLAFLSLSLLVSGFTSRAGAQQPSAAGAAAQPEQPSQPAAAPANAPETTAAAAPAAPAPAPVEAQCIPPCRSTYTCKAGQCVSICNPPCPASEKCGETGQCVRNAWARPLMVPAIAEPQIPPRPPGYEKHDGFMLRLAIGFGGGGAKGVYRHYDGPNEKYSGFSVSFSVDVGGSPVENLVIHARLADFTIMNPTVTVGGEKLGRADNASFGATLFAPALTYYFMPINLYLTAAVGLSRIVFDNGEDVSSASDIGVGLNFDLGKEWWVSDNWGLGLAGRFWYTHASDDEIRWNLLGFAVLFSATYQ